MDPDGDIRVRLSRARLTWLEEQSARWRDAGIIDAVTRARILTGYDAMSNERRSLIALVLVAVLMCGIGLVLLVGYNWEAIPTAAKVALILALVGAAFAGSALAYARGRPVPGEILAFAGTIVFGNAILLIAEVLNIQGHFPDAVFWFSACVLCCAFLVESKWIGIEAAVALGLWVLVEGVASFRPAFVFVPIWLATVILAYRLASPVMLGVAALSGALWAGVGTMEASGGAVMPAAIALAGCALYAIGRGNPGSGVWRGAGSPGSGALRASGAGRRGPASERAWRGAEVPAIQAMKSAWQAAGLAVLSIEFVPLMLTDVQRTYGPRAANGTSIGIAAAVGSIAFAGLLRKSSTAADTGVRIAAVSVVIWALTVWFGLFDNRVTGARVATVTFSILALVMSISLIRTALASSETLHLTFGVVFALVFLLVRWVSVIGNLLWSGLLLLAAGGGLLLVARLWRHRDRNLALPGRLT